MYCLGLSIQSTWNGIYFQLDCRRDLRTLLSFSTYLSFTGVSNDFDRLGVIRDIYISHYEFIIGAYITPRSNLFQMSQYLLALLKTDFIGFS